MAGYDRAAASGMATPTQLANTPVVAPSILLGFGKHNGASPATFRQSIPRLQSPAIPITTASARPGPHRRAHLDKIAAQVVAAYEDPRVRMHDIYHRFGISWEELEAILSATGTPLRTPATHRPPHPTDDGATEKLRCFQEFSEAERADLYRRAWGPGWTQTCVARGY